MQDDASTNREDATRDAFDPNEETCHDETHDSSWLDSNVGARQDEWIGKKIGDFEILRIIGTGGMGNVYEAKQTHPHRSVALKIVKSAAVTPATLHRFEMESEMLARLQHPGIAQVYDSGHQTSEGILLPYFAMEFVPGSRSITDFAEDKKLQRESRLALFLRVCEAVQYGHGRGVIHRDLKPSNILITAGGRPKVIDFGVALMTGSDDSEKTMTVAGKFVGTLQWASPEQCGDDPHDVDVRTDVYSLGVLFYQLMTGQLPYDLKGIPLYRAPIVIRETKPTPPRSIDESIPLEVEQILMKALAKDRSSRYDAVASMAMDIRRFLNNQPILAKPPTTMHRLRLYAKRNQLKFRAGIVVFLALILGLAGLIWGFVESETRQRDMKQALADEAMARTTAEQKAYVAMIGTAQAGIANDSWAMARRSLETTNRKQRGWEWSYFQGLVDQSLRTWLIGDRPTFLVSSPAGKQIAITFESDRVVLVDESRDVMRDLTFPTKVNAVCYSPSGESLILGMDNGYYSILNRSEETMLLFDQKQSAIESIVALKDGSFATGHADGVIRVWDADGNKISSMVGEHGMILTLDYDNAKEVLAAGTFDGTIVLWKIDNAMPVSINQEHAGAVHSVHFVDTNTLASGSADGNIIFWDVATNTHKTIPSGHGEVMGITSNAGVVASTGRDGTVRLWSLESFEPLEVLRGHETITWSIDVLSDDTFVTVGKDGSVRWWNATPSAPTRHLTASKMPSSDVAFVWNEFVVSVSEFDSDLQVINITDGTNSVIRGDSSELSTVAFIPNTSNVVTGDLSGEIRLWDVDKMERGHILGDCKEQITSLGVSLLDKTVAVGTLSGRVCVVRLDKQETIFDSKVSDAIILAVALNDDGTLLSVSVIGGGVITFDLKTGAELWKKDGFGENIVAMEYIHSTQSFITSTSGGTIEMLSALTGDVQKSGDTSGGVARDLVVFPDESRFIIALGDGTLGVWDTGSCSLIASIPAKDSLECVAVSRDGHSLAIGGGSAAIQLLDGMSPGSRFTNSKNRKDDNATSN